MSAAPLLLLLAGVAVQDPVRVQADLSRAEIHVGETSVLRVDVETDGVRAEIGRITRLPPGLELVGSRDYDQRQLRIPGGTRRFVTREFVLRGRAPGEFRVPAVDVLVQGRSYTAPSRVITVTPPPPGLRGPSTGGPEGEVDLRAWLDTDTAYVGQQVTMEAEALFSQSARLRLRRAPEYEAPSPSGFWIDDLPDRRTSSTRIIDNQVYEVQGFRRAFFPLSAGRHAIPPARLEYEMRRGILYAPETFEVLSDSLRLVVLPIPDRGRPAEYTGAVGRYTVRASLEPGEIPAGEAVVLMVEVEGVGNVKALPPPRLPELDGVEVFPPSEEANTEVTDGEVGGRKRFSWVLIPRGAGTLEIPPIRYPYFEPDAGRFEMAEIDGLTLRVTPGNGPVGAERPPTTLRYLRTEPSVADPLAWVDSPWFALAQLLPLLALGAGWAATRKGGGRSRRELRRFRRSRVKELERRAGSDDTAFLPDAEAFARGWIADRLGIRPGEAGQRSALVRAGVPDGAAAGVARVLERIAAARYAPVPPAAEARRAIARELATALERLDRGAPPPPATGPATGRRAGGRAAFLVLALAFAGLAGAAPRNAAAQEAGRSAFARGIARFDATDYSGAAEIFAAHVRAHPEDPAGWYNLGTSHFRAGHPGYAVWSWLHVLRLAPRDEDTRHNLRVAGVSPALVRRVAPPLPLRPVELALLASLAWFLAGAAGGLWLARRGRRRAVAAGVALALAVGLGAVWLASTRGPETVIVLETTTLRAGPTLAGEPLEELQPAAGVVPVARYGSWRRVRTLGGLEGWIEDRSAGDL
ncbi:MAG TPA: BatD family protein [Longimicrobiales bacterium]|nr:BatD family protein [Longimicrobiales bacterium]